jgi:deoxyribonuclease-4
MRIGAHISIAGGIDRAPGRAADLGCEVMQIFTRSPRGGKAPELTEELVKNLRTEIKKHTIGAFYVHTPYYVNFASANHRIRHGSVTVVREELERASELGANFAMTHLGSAREYGVSEAREKVIDKLKETLKGYQGQTKLLLENSAGAGAIIGAGLAELKDIIDQVGSPVIAGVCLDIQHSFASGYDWNQPEAALKRIDAEIGLDRIKLIHANNSLSECGSYKDRHAHIPDGLISLDSFRQIVRWAKKQNIDMILETKPDKVQEDIQALKDLRK